MLTVMSWRERGQRKQGKEERVNMKERARKEGGTRDGGNCDDGIVVSAEAAALSLRAEQVDEGRDRSREGGTEKLQPNRQDQTAPPERHSLFFNPPQAVQIASNGARLPARETNEYLGTLAFQK